MNIFAKKAHFLTSGVANKRLFTVALKQKVEAAILSQRTELA
jgi:hypothetical protein